MFPWSNILKGKLLSEKLGWFLAWRIDTENQKSPILTACHSFCLYCIKIVCWFAYKNMLIFYPPKSEVTITWVLKKRLLKIVFQPQYNLRKFDKLLWITPTKIPDTWGNVVSTHSCTMSLLQADVPLKLEFSFSYLEISETWTLGKEEKSTSKNSARSLKKR